ncbi:MAG: helix-turn-helix domain-containing protein [Phycisphaerae bacterium]
MAHSQWIPSVARSQYLKERILRNWVHQYNHHGIEGLYDRRTQGHRSRLVLHNRHGSSNGQWPVHAPRTGFAPMLVG